MNKKYFSFFKYLKPQRSLITLIVVLSVIQTLLMAIGYLVLPEIIFSLDPNANTGAFSKGNAVSLDFVGNFKEWMLSYVSDLSFIDRIIMMSAIVAIVFFAKNIIDYLRRILTAWFELNVVTKMQADVFAHIIRLPLNRYQEKDSGHFLALLTNDTMQVFISMKRVFEHLITQPLFILSMLSSILFISWKLTSIILVAGPLTALILTYIGKSLSRKSERVLKQNDRFISIITEAFAGIKVLKAFNAEQFQETRFSQALSFLKKLRFRQSMMRSLNIPISETMGILVVVGVLILGAYIVQLEQSITGKDVVTIIFGLVLIIEPIKKLGEIYNEFKVGMVSVERVFDALQIEEDDSLYQAQEKASFDSEITFGIKSFKYGKDANFELKNIQFSLKKGETVALVGASGSGKSTIADLLARFYKSSDHSILIDGQDINHISNASLRELISFVPQESFLFNDSVLSNIRFNTKHKEAEDIEHAARLANAEEFILRLEESYESSVGDRGNKLSGGQKQRISIARALLKNSPIIILDEATSALDSESEQKVQVAIDELMKDHTSLVIAHRLSTIIHADRIIVMDQGKIVEQGKHDELLKKNGHYKNLYDIQFSGKQS